MHLTQWNGIYKYRKVISRQKLNALSINRNDDLLYEYTAQKIPFLEDMNNRWVNKYGQPSLLGRVGELVGIPSPLNHLHGGSESRALVPSTLFPNA